MLSGCNGHASIHAIPLGARKVSTTEPLITHVKPTECYFWGTSNDELCIAAGYHSPSLLGKMFSKSFTLSFVLESPPAGEAREYRVDRRTARSVSRAGFSHTREASLNGKVAVCQRDKERLRGQFRYYAKSQYYSVLTGWKDAAQVLFVGEFVAVANEKRGNALWAVTEEGSMARPPKPETPKPVPNTPRKDLRSPLDPS